MPDGLKLGLAEAEQPFPMSPGDDERVAWRKQVVAEGLECNGVLLEYNSVR